MPKGKEAKKVCPMCRKKYPLSAVGCADCAVPLVEE